MTRLVYWCSRCEYIGDKPDHVDHAEDRWCTGVPVERWLVDPAEAREGWLSASWDSPKVVACGISKRPVGDMTPVFVVTLRPAGEEESGE